MQRLFTGQISITSKKDGFVRVSELVTAENNNPHEGAIFVPHDQLHTALHRDMGVTRETAIETLTYYYGDIVSSLADLAVS
jgi:hypothetical protein